MQANNPLKARLLTIGTEITAGEIVNSNAAWISLQLEQMGLRVYSHLSVRDLREEMLTALNDCRAADILVVCGGLGPTSDDVTREVLAEWAGEPLEFDNAVWSDLNALYEKRGLKILAAHRHQCHFPAKSIRLKNSKGTALGFAMEHDAQKIYVLPGPPHEMQAMFNEEVVPLLKPWLPKSSSRWEHWTTLGVPESEVAEKVDAILEGSGVEVGYRASYPYVKVKTYLDLNLPQHLKLNDAITGALSYSLTGRGHEDLAEEFIKLWPKEILRVSDQVSDLFLSERVIRSARSLRPELKIEFTIGAHTPDCDLELKLDGEGFQTRLGSVTESKVLPFQVKLSMERGKRAAAEWALWFCVRQLRAKSAKA